MYIHMYMYIHTDIYDKSLMCLFFEVHLSCFRILGIINNAEVNMGMHIFFQISFSFSSLNMENGIAGSYARSIFNILRNFHTVFHNDCTKSPSRQQLQALFPPYPRYRLLFVSVISR